jgi:hypothetical protein
VSDPVQIDEATIAAIASAAARATVEALEQRGLLTDTPPGRVLSVDDVVLMLGRDREWVYAHKADLGAFRLGDGPRARLGFDEHRIRDWLLSREVRPPRVRPEPHHDASDRRGRMARGDRRPAVPLIPFDTDPEGT